MGTGIGQEATSKALFTQEEMNREITNARNTGFNAGYVNGARESNPPSAFVNQAQNTSKGLLSKLGLTKTVTAVLLGASVAILAATVFSGGTALVLAAAAGLAYYHLADRSESSQSPIYYSTPPSYPGPGRHDQDTAEIRSPRGGLDNVNNHTGSGIGNPATRNASSHEAEIQAPLREGEDRGQHQSTQDVVPSGDDEIKAASLGNDTPASTTGALRIDVDDKTVNKRTGEGESKDLIDLLSLYSKPGGDTSRTGGTKVNVNVHRSITDSAEEEVDGDAFFKSDKDDRESISSEVGRGAERDLTGFSTGDEGGNQIDGQESVEGATEDGHPSALARLQDVRNTFSFNRVS